MLKRTLAAILLGLLQLLLTARTCLAHDAPQGSEWVMADWMFLTFLLFGGVAFVAFLMALKSGLLSNLEEAKYYMLTIQEEDYYAPDWARPGGEA